MGVLVAALFAPASVRAQADSAGAAVLPSEIPIFPLPDVVLFPDTARPLLIFEPRYRSMIADAIEGDRIIGMVKLRPGYEADYEGRPPIYSIGCAGSIVEFEQLPDGRYTVVLQALVKFRVTSEDQSRSYRLARVEPIPEVLTSEEREALHLEREHLVDLLTLSVAPGSPPPPPELLDDYVVNVLAQNLALAPFERQELLELDGPLARARALIALLEMR